MNCSKKLAAFIFSILFTIGMTVVIFIMGVSAIRSAANVNTDEVKPLLVSISGSSFHIGNMVFGIILGSLAMGFCLVMTVGFLVCGYLCKMEKILIKYAIAVLIFAGIVGVLFGLSLTVKVDVESKIQEKMGQSFRDNYVDDTLTSSNSISNAWNHMFMTIDCCGVISVQSKTNDFDTTPWCTYSGTCQEGNSEIPKTCCLSVDEDTYLLAPNDCYASVTSGTYNAKGCYDALEDQVLKETTNFIFLTAFCFAFAAASGVLAIFLNREQV